MKFRILYFLLFLYVGLFSQDTTLHNIKEDLIKSTLTTTNMLNRPFYFLKITNRYCNFIFKVNDIQVYSETENGNISTAFPINEYLNIDGNIATVEVLPMEGKLALDPRATVEIMLEVASVDSLNNRKTIYTDTTPDFTTYQSEGKPLPPLYLWTLPLNTPVPFKNLHLYNLTTHIPNDSLKAELVKAFQEIYNSFDTKNADEIRLHFKFRIEDKSVVRYQKIEEFEKDLKRSLSVDFTDTELYTFEAKDFKIRSEYGNRLFSLVDENNEPVILLYNETINITTYYKMRFGKIKGQDKWVVIR
jgi:RNase H-fold protein (predicted Holliday junction resolvase)